MMPDLGKYAGAVLWSYGAGLAILALIIGLSLWQSARIRRALEQASGRVGRSDG